MNIAYTVALCTHNHADRLVRTLARPGALTGAARAVGIAGHRQRLPRRHTRAAGSPRWPAGWQVRVVREEKLGLSNARNRAIAEARGEYVIFMDDDETADPDWLCAFERLIDAHHPDAFGGRRSCCSRTRGRAG